MTVRRFLSLSGLLLLIAGFVAIYGVLSGRADPHVRRGDIALRDWPAGAAPVRIVLLSDLHIASLSMGSARLNRIVDQVNALHPDLVLIAGDFIFGVGEKNGRRYAPMLVQPLGRLRARLGVLAVPGNHDHETDMAALRSALARAHVTLLANQAVARGPLAIAGIDDQTTRHADVLLTMRRLAHVPGARLAFTHSPDVVSDLPPALPVLLAGHTHCGQVLPQITRPLMADTKYARRLLCGRMVLDGHTLIVTGGTGTSGVPFRIGAPPDLWVITVGPPAGVLLRP